MACLATRGRASQRELQHAGPESRGRGHGGGDGEGGHRLADGVGPVEMVDGPQRIRTGRLGPSAHLGERRGTPGITRGTTGSGRQFSQRGGGEDEP